MKRNSHSRHHSTPGAEERRQQRNAVLASFLGWTFDAFDFFVLTFLITDIAKTFGESRPNVAFTLTLTLAMRPFGALIFGMMADRYGRRLPMTINIVFYALMSALSGLAPDVHDLSGAARAVRDRHGRAVGRGASLVLESVSPRWRGVLSGLLHQGYSLGNLLAALAFLTVYPRMAAINPDYAWRAMFFLGGLPALLSIFVLVKVKESEAWQEHRTDWRTYVRSMPAAWRRFLYLVLLLTVMGFISHGTQDLYPTFLQQQRHFAPEPRGRDDDALDGRRDHRRPGDRVLLRPVRPAPRDDRRGVRRAGRRPALDRRANVGVDRARWLPDAVLRAGRVGRHSRAHERTVAGEPARLSPGFAYQIGMVCAGIAPYIETVMGEHFSYAQSMGYLAGAALIVGMIVIGLGPEAHGINFRKSAAP